jgi:hypothetical protein
MSVLDATRLFLIAALVLVALGLAYLAATDRRT